MMERNTKKFNCLYFSYQRYCTKEYYKDFKKFGWADLTEHECNGKCQHFKKKNLFNKFIFWLTK